MKTSLLTACLFLIVICYSIVQPVRAALVATEMGSASLPLIWVWSSVATALVVMAYSKMLDRMSKLRMLICITIFFACTLLVVRLFMDRKISGLSAVFYVWGEVFSVVMVEHVWSMAAESFDTSTAKRCYGHIASGAVVGGILGSSLVVFATKTIGTHNLIYVCVAVLLPMLACAWGLNRINRNNTKTQISHILSQQEESETQDLGFLSGFHTLFSSRYLITIAAVVLFNQVVSNLVNYQSNALVESSISGLDARTEYFGKIFLTIGVISLVLSSGFAGSLMNRLGVKGTLFALPLANMASALASLLLPGAGAGAMLRVVDKSLNYSLNRSSKEILYIPVPACTRDKAKSVIDMFIYRMSKIVGTALIVPVSYYVPVQWLGLVNLALLVPTCALVFCAGNAFERLSEPVKIKSAPARSEFSTGFEDEGVIHIH